MSENKQNLSARFEARKQGVVAEEIADEKLEIEAQQSEITAKINQLTDADMPDLKTLDEDSDYSMFLSEKVTPALRKKALRKLFLSSKINVLDGLNDYDENYTNFAGLGDVIPYDLKQELQKEAKNIADNETKNEVQQVEKSEVEAENAAKPAQKSDDEQ